MRQVIGDVTRRAVDIRYLRNASKNAYHVFTDIECSLDVARFFADEIYRSDIVAFSGTDGKSIIDSAIYRPRGSLRLFDCLKLDPVRRILVQDTQYALPRDQDPWRYMMTNTWDCYRIEQPLHLMSSFGIDEKYFRSSSDIAAEKHEAVLSKWLKDQGIARFTLSSSGCFINAIVDGRYFCPIHRKNHDSDNLYAVVRNGSLHVRCRRGEGDEIQPLFVEAISNNAQQRYRDAEVVPLSTLEGAQLQSQKWFSLPESARAASTLFVRSPLGSGKTKQLEELYANRDGKKWLSLSHRITFSQSMAPRFPGMLSYQDIKGALDLDEPLILQVDSLARLRPSEMPDILVVDEIESILTQLVSKHCRIGSAYKIFLDLVKRCGQLIVLDGLLQQTTIDLVNRIRGLPHQVIENAFPMYENVPCTVTITDEKNSVVAEILALSDQDRSKDHKTVIHATSRSKAMALAAMIREKQGRSVEILHGRNEEYDDEESMYHGQRKKELVPVLTEALSSIDVLIYTGTISAGVSIDCPGIGHVIGWMSRGCGDAMQFA